MAIRRAPGATWKDCREQERIVDAEIAAEYKQSDGCPIAVLALDGAVKLLTAGRRISRHGNDHRDYMPWEALSFILSAGLVVKSVKSCRERRASDDKHGTKHAPAADVETPHDCNHSPCPHYSPLLVHFTHRDCPKQPGIAWSDEWSSACDSECPGCGADIQAIAWHAATVACNAGVCCRMKAIVRALRAMIGWAALELRVRTYVDVMDDDGLRSIHILSLENIRYACRYGPLRIRNPFVCRMSLAEVNAMTDEEFAKDCPF